MTRPARVLWLAKGLGRGGAERLLSLSVAHVDPQRFAVEVAYLLPWKDALVEEIRQQDIPVHCLGCSHPADPRWVLRLRRLVRARRFDLIHTHAPHPAVAARVALAPGTPRLVHTEHNVWQRYRHATFVSNAVTYARNDAVIAVSRGVAESLTPPPWLPARTMPPVEVLHHGIDETKVRWGAQARASARSALGIDPHRRVLGTVANFTPKKDQASLLRAVRLLADEYPDVLLVLVGTGPCEDALRAQVRRDGLHEHVLFAGSRDDVQKILPAFDVFVLSSLHEGLSIALIEAMAAGVPCVSTNVGGVPEAMADGCEGFLVQPRDPRALAHATGQLLTDPELSARMAAAARDTAKRFSVLAAVRRMEALYDEVLGAA